MKISLTLAATIFIVGFISAQEPDHDLFAIKNKLESVDYANANVTLRLDVEFIKMPAKSATINYHRGSEVEFDSEDFILIPKRGLDFTWQELFRYEFLTVDRGEELRDGKTLRILNIIPIDEKADFAIMTLKIDAERKNIQDAEITTKKEGTFNLHFTYLDYQPFPSEVVAEFEMERIKIPLNFMGKDADIDKEMLKSKEVKKGRIYLSLDWKEIG